jgi:hypothetical protein
LFRCRWAPPAAYAADVRRIAEQHFDAALRLMNFFILLRQDQAHDEVDYHRGFLGRDNHDGASVIVGGDTELVGGEYGCVVSISLP